MMWHWGKDPGAGQLVAECEAFLYGTYAEHLEALGQPVPAWAWANVLAHGTDDEVRDVARRPATGGWGQARRFLAGELVDHIDSCNRNLHDLQHNALIPLELELASAPATGRWGPAQLVAAVLAALPDRRARERR